MSSSIECSFKSLISPGSNEILSSQNSLTFKLLKTGKSDAALIESTFSFSRAGQLLSRPDHSAQISSVHGLRNFQF